MLNKQQVRGANITYTIRPEECSRLKRTHIYHAGISPPIYGVYEGFIHYEKAFNRVKRHPHCGKAITSARIIDKMIETDSTVNFRTSERMIQKHTN